MNECTHRIFGDDMRCMCEKYRVRYVTAQKWETVADFSGDPVDIDDLLKALVAPSPGTNDGDGQRKEGSAA